MQLTYREALQSALRDELTSDADVFVFGLDVDDHKAIFGSVDGLLKQFGPERIFGTPLSEEAMTGFAVGAALRGLKPVHIHIRADFGLLAMNQLVNMLSNIRYMTAGQLQAPVVIRMVIGRGWGQGMQHSKSLHSVLSHFPGLKILMPTTPQEAYSLTREAVQSRDPHIIFEHRWLYDIQGHVETDLKISDQPFRLHYGRDLTIISTSWMSIESLRVAQILKSHHINCDVFNVSRINASNWSGVYKSVEASGHALVLDHDWAQFGFASEVSSLIHENCFPSLKSPVRRLGFAEIPCPTARELENVFYPNMQRICNEICGILNIKNVILDPADVLSYENKFRGPF